MSAPKRPVDALYRATGGPSSPKKPRFDLRNPSALAPDAPEEDVVLDADEIGRRGAQTKRNAVNIDGYDSDSSNEGFDARAEAKARDSKKVETQSKEEEEADMFADLDEEVNGQAEEGADAEAARRRGAKKKVQFVEVDEIEGQVESSTGGGSVRADFAAAKGWNDKGKGKARMEDANGIDAGESSESEPDDAEERGEAGSDVDDEIGAGGKKKHAPKLDAFNLNAEKEEGGFDEQLNFVRKAVDPDAIHDNWLQGVSKKDMRKAKEAEEKRAEEQRKQRREDDEILTSDLLAELIKRLNTSENVLEALARLGPKKKKPKWATGKNRNKSKGDMDVDKPEEEVDPEEKKRADSVEALTGAADKLMGRGNHDIYDTERELLMRLYQRETGEAWEAEIKDDEPQLEAEEQWEYRWSDARDGGGTHGPYDGPTMNAWNAAGYFGEGVEFRVVGEEHWRKEIAS